MVDGGGRCSCQDDLDLEEGGDPPTSACCSAQVFTSVLLGLLACVLMTGGVFLAFHRWDPLWLIVSGIGVLLILIGSILHCCGDSQDNSRARHRGPAGKGCCGGRPDHMNHGHHLVVNNGSLTEQLLPLSNARSVSQLSLNMLPGYFPPVVTTYGIEQHSAVVQNISRLAQQQSPGAQNSAGGKSFILLSLPGNEPAQQTSVQNLVGYTVYQLEESSAVESPSLENTATTPPATATTVPSSPTTPSVHPPLFKSVEVQTCHVWPSAGINPNNSQNASGSNSSTDLSPSENVENNKPLQNASCSAVSSPSGVIQNNCMQKCSSSNSESVLSEIVQNDKPMQNASCSSSPPTESVISGIMQSKRMQKSSSSNSSTNTPATPGTSQNSFSESDMPRMSRNHNVTKNSSDNSCTESSPSESSLLPKTGSSNSFVDSVAADPQQPSTSRTHDIAEVANCSTAAIPPICDNAKSISDGTTQSPRTLEDTPVSEASSSAPVDSSGESLLVVAIPEPPADNGDLLELATPATTDILVEVDTTTYIPPVSTTSVDISAVSTYSSVNPSVSTMSSVSPSVSTISFASPSLSTISSVSPSVSVSSADVPAMSTSFVDVSLTSTTYIDVPSTSTSIYDVPRSSTISADVPPVSIISADVPLASSENLIDISCNNPTSSSDIVTSNGGTVAAINLTHQTVSDIGVSRSDTSLSNLSDIDGEVDDSELLDRFSPPPSYDDAILEGDSAIGAFGLAYGTM